MEAFAIITRLPHTIIRSFRGWGSAWVIFAIAVSYACVVSGFDWFYFTVMRTSSWYSVLFPAVVVGSVVPIYFPALLFFVGTLWKRARSMMRVAYVLWHAALAGLLVSWAFKLFTGRIPPPHTLTSTTADASHGFRLGLDNGGVFWGWPSSHTTVAFAMAFALIALYPRNAPVKVLAIAYALYIGLGVSMSIHWFSDFVAGAIIGAVVGISAGKSFRVLYN